MTRTECPCCGTIVETDMLVDLCTNTVALGDATLEMSPQEAEFLYVLREVWPNTIGYEVMADRVWGMLDDRTSQDRRQHLAVLASKVRSKLKEFIGVDIDASRGRGFRLVIQQGRTN